LQGVESSIIDVHSTVRSTAKEPLDEGFSFVRETGFASYSEAAGWFSTTGPWCVPSVE